MIDFCGHISFLVFIVSIFGFVHNKSVCFIAFEDKLLETYGVCNLKDPEMEREISQYVSLSEQMNCLLLVWSMDDYWHPTSIHFG